MKKPLTWEEWVKKDSKWSSAICIVLSIFCIATSILNLKNSHTDTVEPTQSGSFGGADRFELVDEWTSTTKRACQVYRDTTTNVMYLWVRDGNTSGLTVLLNEDGSPMLYDGVEDEFIEEALG